MKIKRSLVVLDDRAVLVDGIVTVAQYTFPELRVVAGPESAGLESIARISPVARPARAAAGGTDEQVVLVVGGRWLRELPESRPIQAAMASGACVIALVDGATAAEAHTLRANGVCVFVCTSEGMNELLRGIERAFERESYLSPDSEALLSRPTRLAPRISPRERQIVLLYLSENDWTVDDVAGMLQISSQTVRSHLARLRSHFTAAGFSVRNRLELRQALVEIGMIDPAQTAPAVLLPSLQAAGAGEPRFRYAGSPLLNSRVG